MSTSAHSRDTAATTGRICRVLLLASAAHDEFLPVVRWLQTQADVVLDTDDLRADSEQAAVPPALIVVCLSRPDELTDDELLGLLARWPLGRFVLLLGRWCDAAGRTRPELPRGLCVEAAAFEVRLQAELDAIRGERLPLPVTASRDETFAAEFLNELELAELPADDLSDVGLVIESGDPQLAAAVRDLWKMSGGRAGPHGDAAVVLWDVDSLESAGRQDFPAAVAELRRAHGLSDAIPVVAIGGYATREEIASLEAAGVSDFLLKTEPWTKWLRVLCRVAGAGWSGASGSRRQPE